MAYHLIEFMDSFQKCWALCVFYIHKGVIFTCVLYLLIIRVLGYCFYRLHWMLCKFHILLFLLLLLLLLQDLLKKFAVHLDDCVRKDVKLASVLVGVRELFNRCTGHHEELCQHSKCYQAATLIRRAIPAGLVNCLLDIVLNKVRILYIYMTLLLIINVGFAFCLMIVNHGIYIPIEYSA